MPFLSHGFFILAIVLFWQMADEITPEKSTRKGEATLKEIFKNNQEFPFSRKPASLREMLNKPSAAEEGHFFESPPQLKSNSHESSDEEFSLSVELMNVSVSGNLEECVSLLTEGKKEKFPNVYYLNASKQTPLHLATEKGYYEICQALIEYGNYQTLDLFDQSSSTPLHVAAELNRQDIAKLLVRNGADINLQDGLGNTPTHYAILNDNSEMFQLFLHRDANLSLTNNDGNTPIEMANGPKMLRELCFLNITPKPIRPSFKTVCVEDEKIIEEEKDVEIEDFEFIRAFKKISNGEILYSVKHKHTGKCYNIKRIKQSILKERQLLKKYNDMEIKVLGSVDSPFINKLNHVKEDERFVSMIFDSTVSDLSKLLSGNPFSENVAKFYACEIILAIEELHANGFIYRNIRAKNIEVDETGHIKLTQFGFSKEEIYDNKGASSFFLSFTHFPPEVLSTEGHGRAVDWYMLGVLLYEMILGKTPFYSEDPDTMVKNIKTATVNLPIYLSRNASDLIKRLLDKKPETRLGTLGASEVKSHAFFSDVDWEAVYQKRLSPPIEEFVDFSKISITSSFFSVSQMIGSFTK